MLNIEKYKKTVLDSLNYCILDSALENTDIGLKEKCNDRKCRECKKHYREWLLSEHQILDDAEKRYLKGVIRPFRNEVKSIWKLSYVSEQIVIQMQSGIEIKLPCFKKGTMYQGMEESKKYTIEELGL